MNPLQTIRKKWLESRWIGMPALPDGVLLQPSKQAAQGVVMGMRVAVLEEQAAAVLAEGRLISVFLPGAYTLEEAKMPRLTPDPKCEWLFPAEVLFLNLMPFNAQPWGVDVPLLARDPDFGLVQLVANGTYEAQVTNVTVFIQKVVVERGWREWSPVHQWLSARLSNLIIDFAARQQLQLARLDKFKERACQALLQEVNLEFKKLGLTINKVELQQLELHPTMQRLLQERPSLQADTAAYNQAIMRSLLG